MAYQVVTKSNHTFWLMTSSGNWISSHHSTDEAVAACRAWFKCSPIVRTVQAPVMKHSLLGKHVIDKNDIKQKLTNYLASCTEIFRVFWNTLLNNKNKKRMNDEL